MSNPDESGSAPMQLLDAAQPAVASCLTADTGSGSTTIAAATVVVAAATSDTSSTSAALAALAVADEAVPSAASRQRKRPARFVEPSAPASSSRKRPAAAVVASASAQSPPHAPAGVAEPAAETPAATGAKRIRRGGGMGRRAGGAAATATPRRRRRVSAGAPAGAPVNAAALSGEPESSLGAAGGPFSDGRPYVFEVEILGTQKLHGVTLHRVHYVGLESDDDEWVPEELLMLLDGVPPLAGVPMPSVSI